jgi:mono/diheme cytochrome c family protein
LQLVRVAILIAALVVVAAVVLVWAGAKPEIPATQPLSADSFDRKAVMLGAQLAAIGNCDVCHTQEGGEIFAGARAIPTPFGSIYSTNITPDPETGIGRWSEAAFQRAMREGISRSGRQLYPAFPYDHFTLVTVDDNHALYAYLMTRAPVRAPARGNELWFPLSWRPLIALWKVLYFKPRSFQPAASQDSAWNRGAYLVDGLGHCGACHTPRNAFGAERRTEPDAGGRVEGWDAYALDASAPAPVPWTIESLQMFLQRGWHVQHGVSCGPMAPVTADLAMVPTADLHAIAVFIASQTNSTHHEPATTAAQSPGTGAQIYQATCATCHDGSADLPFGGIDLRLSTAVNSPTPRNLINVTLQGLAPPAGQAGPIMPGINGAMSDSQLAAMLAYLRARYSAGPSWNNIPSEIRAARRDFKRANAS